MRRIGFSTGAVARGDFRRALDLLRGQAIDVVELSALRMSELEPLLSAIPHLDLRYFSFISVHAPSWFTIESEQWVVDQLNSISWYGFPLVVHPDVIFTPRKWQHFRERLLVENMDRRKPIGRNVRELRQIFDWLPEARFCFDIGHARQVDPSMTESSLLLGAFGNRLGEVHISEVNTASRHDPISPNAVIAFQSVAKYIPEDVPIMLETLIDKGQSEIQREVERAREALTVVSLTASLSPTR
jgi:hypothetical protein